MILYLLENALTDFFLISLTSCLDRVVYTLKVSLPSVWLDFEIINVIQNEVLCVTVAMVTAVAWKPTKT